MVSPQAKVPYQTGMTQPSPRCRLRAGHENPLDYEIAQEQAAALGRLGRALEAALAALSDHDRARAERGPDSAAGAAASATPIRQELVRQAGYALWCFIVQREACGLRDQRLIIREYGIPAEVQNHVGVFGAQRQPSIADS
jgi:hypothetical protein